MITLAAKVIMAAPVSSCYSRQLLPRSSAFAIPRTTVTSAGLSSAWQCRGSSIPKCVGLRGSVRKTSVSLSRRSSTPSTGRGLAVGVVCMAHSAVPPAKGLFNPENDKDSCGVGFVGQLNRRPSRSCVVDALEMLKRMAHRGACGCEANTGKAT